jgi:hypothetical protein
MPFLRYHPADERGEPDPYRFPGRQTERETEHDQQERRAGRLTFTDDDDIRDPVADVERAIEKVDARLKNLRELVDQFGLDGDGDGPRAA